MKVSDAQFFQDRKECIQSYKSLPWQRRALYSIQSIGQIMIHLAYLAGLIYRRVEQKMAPLGQAPEGGYQKQKLVVLIHGLNSSPAEFEKTLEELCDEGHTCQDYYVPKVLKRGNVPLNEAVAPILETIRNWAASAPEKELTLVGISNGARIARAIESELASTSNIKKIRFISIAGACKGSKFANLLKRWKLSWLTSKPIAKEMPTDSTRCQELNAKWSSTCHLGPKREYVFIASPHDWQVTNYSSSLMKVQGSPARYMLIPGHGHTSIGKVVAPRVAALIKNSHSLN